MFNEKYERTFYEYDDREFVIYYLNQDAWDKKMIDWKNKKKCPYPLWFMKRFVRGFTYMGIIYIKEGTKFGLDRLILHEIGHILGYKHTWKPNLMFRSWIGRWFKRFPKNKGEKK